jgi:Zn-dependent protease
MRDPFHWSLSLGRWSGVSVRISAILALFLVLQLLGAGLEEGQPVLSTAAWLGLLLVVLALHELAHVLAALRLGVESDEVLLWPLGNLSNPIPVFGGRGGPEGAIVASAGLITSGCLALGTAIGLNLMGEARMVFSPFGNELGTGAPILADGRTVAAAFTPVWWLGWFGYLNWVVFLANLIPAAPLDMGRVLRSLTDQLIASWTARAAAILLVIAGVFRLFLGSHGSLVLIMLGIFLYLITRIEARMLDEGGFFDDNVFGYDFSQGYTSLEASTAAVRPRREGAIGRWRRRRSELRRRRREAREAAEEQRMDELLDKIHREGRAGLTAEEQRFLVRVAAKYRNRSKS